MQSPGSLIHSEGSYNIMCWSREKLSDPRTNMNSGCLPATVSVLIPGQSGRVVFMSITKSTERTEKTPRFSAPGHDLHKKHLSCVLHSIANFTLFVSGSAVCYELMCCCLQHLQAPSLIPCTSLQLLIDFRMISNNNWRITSILCPMGIFSHVWRICPPRCQGPQDRNSQYWQ